MLNTRALALIVALGCGSSTGRSWSAHPATAGAGATTAAHITHADYELQRSLPPGSLDHIATLTDFDAESICVDVAIRGLSSEDGEIVTRLDNYTVRLLVDGAPIVVGETTATHLRYQDHQGRTQRIQKVQHVRRCPALNRDGWTACGHRQPTFEPVARSSQLTIVEGGGVLCATHGGQITAATKKIEVRLEPIHQPRRCRARSSSREINLCDGELVFRWIFD